MQRRKLPRNADSLEMERPGTMTREGLSREEIGEAKLHAIAYCGAPAGVNTIGVARQLFAELDREKPKTTHGKGRGSGAA